MTLPVTIPNTFANATTSIPLANLDANFVTIYDAVNGIGNGAESLANVSITGGTASNVTVEFAAGTNTAPSITTVGDTNTGIFFPAADTIAFAEGGAEAMRIDSSGNVGIGTTSPVAVLSTVNTGALTLDSNDGNHTGFGLFLTGPTTQNTVNSAIGYGLSGGRKLAAIGFQTYGDADQVGMNFYVQPSATGSAASLTEAMRITSAGEVLVGGTTSINANEGCITLQRAGNLQPIVSLLRNDTSISSGDGLGYVGWYATDTTSNAPTLHAYVQAVASGTHSAGDNPTDLVFGTTPAGSATVTEAMRITDDGSVEIGISTGTGYLNVRRDGAGIVEVARFGNTNVSTGHRLAIAVDDDNNMVYYTSTGASAGGHMFRTGGTNILEIRTDGTLDSQDTYDNTQSGSTVVVTSGGLIGRTSSSIKYKKDVETLDADLVSNAIANLRPVWYRTKDAKGDDKETWSHIGLIAEEVHEVEPRLVRYRTENVEFVDVEEQVTKTRELSPAVTDEEGNVVQEAVTEEYTETVTRQEKQKTPLETPEPEDVDYGRLAVLCLAKIQQQEKTIAALEARLSALEAK